MMTAAEGSAARADLESRVKLAAARLYARGRLVVALGDAGDGEGDGEVGEEVWCSDDVAALSRLAMERRGLVLEWSAGYRKYRLMYPTGVVVYAAARLGTLLRHLV